MTLAKRRQFRPQPLDGFAGTSPGEDLLTRFVHDSISIQRQSGTNFNDTPAGNTVFIGGSQARVVGSPSTSQIRVIVPPCVAAGAVPVVVQVGSIRTAPLTPAPTYVASTPTLDLAVNEGITVAGTELGSCLRLPGNGAG